MKSKRKLTEYCAAFISEISKTVWNSTRDRDRHTYGIYFDVKLRIIKLTRNKEMTNSLSREIPCTVLFLILVRAKKQKRFLRGIPNDLTNSEYRVLTLHR